MTKVELALDEIRSLASAYRIRAKQNIELDFFYLDDGRAEAYAHAYELITRALEEDNDQG